MLGLSITAIGLRPFRECLSIFKKLQQPMQLDFLELAIGSSCSTDFDYSGIPLILHDSCLYEDGIRKRLNLLHPKTLKVGIYTRNSLLITMYALCLFILHASTNARKMN